MKMIKDAFGRIPCRIYATTLALYSTMVFTHAALANGAGGETSAWQYELTPYLWAARMKGDLEAGPLPETHVDMKFSDILNTLDFGFMSAFEARKDRVGLLFDGMYMKNSDAVTATRSELGLTAKAGLQIEQTMLSAAVAYRAIDSDWALDVVGGARSTAIDANATIEGNLYGLSGSVERAGDKDWVDPFVGVAIEYPLGERWKTEGYADVGGFSVGSDFTWQAIVGVDYAFSDSLSAKLGYRYMKIDYDHDDFIYDMASDGLYIGMSMGF